MKEFIKDVRDQLICLMVEMEYDESDICEVFNIKQEQIEKAEQKQKHIFYPTWIRNINYKENIKRKKKLRRENIVYFIRQDVPEGMIKIGYTSRGVKNRLSTLNTNSPYNLIVIKTIEGDLGTEKKLHKKFAKHRLNGEWFYPHQEIISYIDSL